MWTQSPLPSASKFPSLLEGTPGWGEIFLILEGAWSFSSKIQFSTKDMDAVPDPVTDCAVTSNETINLPVFLLPQ